MITLRPESSAVRLGEPGGLPVALHDLQLLVENAGADTALVAQPGLEVDGAARAGADEQDLFSDELLQKLQEPAGPRSEPLRFRHAGEQARPVRLEVVQGRDRRGDAARVPAVGRVKGPVVLLHRCRDRRRRDHRPNRRQPPAHRFGHAQHVRIEVEVLAREQAAGPAESARDFIGDEQRAVTAAEVAYPPDGVFFWNQDAEIDADRLHDECGDVAPLQPLLDAAQCFRVERRGNLAAVWQQVLDLLAVVRRADAQSGKRVAVIAAF